MMGQIPPCGTGETDIIIDEGKLVQDESDDEDLDDIDNWEEQLDDNFCENIGADFNYDSIMDDNIQNIPQVKI